MRSTYVFIAVAALLFSGCAKLTSKTGLAQYKTVVQSSRHDEAKARKKHQHAIKHMRHGNYSAAEQMLQDALLADVTFGPAHNTLGKLYFDQRKHYLAAWEFEYAQRLMPDRGEPVNNLGLVYESTGQLEKAISFYEQACILAPDNANYLGNLIRARIRNGEDPLLLKDLIERLVFIDHRQDWVDWARSKLELGQGSDGYLFLNESGLPYEDLAAPHHHFGDVQPMQPAVINDPPDPELPDSELNNVLPAPQLNLPEDN